MRSFLGLACMIPLYKYSTVGLGWSDLVLFSNFKTYCRSGIFLGVQFQKIGNFFAARVAKMSFSKTFAETFLYTSKNNSRDKICLVFFFLFQKWTKRLFNCTRKKKLYFLVSLRFFLSNKLKKFFLFQVQPLKM